MQTEPKSILLLGSGGSGKSTLLLQLPKLLLVNCDKLLAGPNDYLKCKNFSPDAVIKSAWEDKNGKPLEMHECYDRVDEILKETREELKVKPGLYQNVAVDGLSMLGDFIKQKIFNKQDREAMEGRDWDVFKSGVVKVVVVHFRSINALGANTWLPAHEKHKTKKPAKGQKNVDIFEEILIGIRPLIQGESEEQLAGQFSDVWGMSSRPGGAGTVEFVISTVKDGLRDLKKSSYKMPSEIIIKDGELVWPKIKEFVQTGNTNLDTVTFSKTI